MSEEKKSETPRTEEPCPHCAFLRGMGITLLDKKWLDPECHEGCKSLILKRELAEAKAKADEWHSAALDFGRSSDAYAKQLEEKTRELEEAREEHHMQLAAISTASIQNTESSKSDRIDETNPYWTVAYSDVCIAIDREIQRINQFGQWKAIAERLAKGIESVQSLISDSKGVYGLHLNGDPSPWSELRTGGHFESWLVDFDKALESLAAFDELKRKEGE